jgi:predicted RNA methylase
VFLEKNPVSIPIQPVHCNEINGYGGRKFVDFGAGQGRALISAIIMGAREAFGVELPQNMNHEFVFNAVHKLMTNLGLHPSLLLSNAEWHPEDIDNVIFL